MNPSISLETHVLNSKRLESLIRKDIPVVPDTIIKTFSHVRGDDVDLVLAQDREDLSTGSFILKRGDFARFFLDLWFDPLYRSYAFVKAETHALVRHNAGVLSLLLKLKNFNRTTLFNGIPLFWPSWP